MSTNIFNGPLNMIESHLLSPVTCIHFHLNPSVNSLPYNSRALLFFPESLADLPATQPTLSPLPLQVNALPLCSGKINVYNPTPPLLFHITTTYY